MEIPTFSVNTSYEVDVSVAEVVNADFRMRSNEKVEMQDLNDRFATYIDKVHILERKNRRLRLEQTKGEATSCMYEERFRELTRNVEELRTQKCHVEVQRDNLNEQIKEQQHKLQKEANLREEAERNLQQVKKNLQDSHKNVDNAKLVHIGLEQKIETQQQEINFIKLLHEKELRYLKMQQFPVEVDMLPPNLTGCLRDIHAEYESIATKKLTYAELIELSVAAARNNESLCEAKLEANLYRGRMQSLKDKIGSLEGENKSLKERFDSKADGYQNTISDQEENIRKLKEDMDRKVYDYQNLLNVKMALDCEIAVYRRLLEDEKKWLQKEANLREEAERNLQQVKKNLQDSHKNVDNAKLVQIVLEQRIKTQQGQSIFVKHLHEKELRYLNMQDFNVEVDMFPPNLTGSLQDIRASTNPLLLRSRRMLRSGTTTSYSSSDPRPGLELIREDTVPLTSSSSGSLLF
uniref:vimentin-like isoform X1 n=1 Tax=Myxine glutinosa TaxID=7769 RepID=UPI00358F82AD